MGHAAIAQGLELFQEGFAELFGVDHGNHGALDRQFDQSGLI
jgi:hypothetical protein